MSKEQNKGFLLGAAAACYLFAITELILYDRITAVATFLIGFILYLYSHKYDKKTQEKT